MTWPSARARDGGIDRIPLAGVSGGLSLCGKHVVGPDPAAALVRADASTVVCLNPERELVDRYPEYVRWLRDHQHGRAVWFPIPDLGVLPLDQMRPFLDGLVGRIAAGEHLLIHCGAGIGRAGTTAVCLLMLHDVSMPQALVTVASELPLAGPEAGSQRQLVAELAATTRR
jgi:protein-tyrosine phosphatase